MPKKQSTTKPTPSRSCTLTEAEETRLQCILEQVEGCVDLLCDYLDVDSDNPAMTGLNVIKEKSHEARAVIRDAFRRTVTGK